jgi:hypothetical protein
MSENRRSFWSSVPGLVTGLAGLLTGIVGLVTVLIQLGVVGGKSDDKTTAATGATSTTVTTLPGASTTGFGVTTTAAATGTFTVPSTLDFPSGVKEKPLTVKNTSPSGTITVRQPTLTGPDAARFTVSLDTCAQPLAAGLSCTMTVTFAPNVGLKTYSATLQVTASGTTRGAEVALTASVVL